MARIFVTGASGTIGGAITNALAESQHTPIAAVRTPEKAASLKERGIETRAFDYADRSTWSEAKDCEVVVLVGPPGDPQGHHLVNPFIEYMAEAGVSRFITVSARGIEDFDGVSLREIEKAAEATGKPVLLLRPTWVMQNFGSFLLPGLKYEGVLRLPAGDGRVAFVDARDLGDCAVKWLQQETPQTLALDMTGPSALSYGEAVSMLSAAAGRDLTYEAVPFAAFKAGMLEFGVPEANIDFMEPMWAAVAAGHDSATSSASADFLGRPQRSLEDYAAESGGLFR